MTTLPNMSLVLPTVGGSSGSWGTMLNTLLTLIDEHDHSSGKGILVTPSGISINANLTFAGYYATNMGAIAFTPRTALASGSTSIFVSSADNELYWRSSGGTNVKLTSGTALNVAAFVGGIGGDYTAVSAELNYDSASTAYTHKGASGTNWALLRSGEVRIYESGTAETFYVGQAAPAALASSYTATWPTALPGSTQLVQITSAGVMSFSNTVVNAATFSGLITASAGLTASANQHVTVSGTGELKHGDRVLQLSASMASPSNANFTRGSVSTGQITSSGGACSFFVALPLIAGDRAKSISVLVGGDGAADATVTVYSTAPDGTGSSIGTTTITNPTSAAPTAIDITDTTITSTTSIHVVIEANAANLALYRVSVTYDHP